MPALAAFPLSLPYHSTKPQRLPPLSRRLKSESISAATTIYSFADPSFSGAPGHAPRTAKLIVIGAILMLPFGRGLGLSLLLLLTASSACGGSSSDTPPLDFVESYEGGNLYRTRGEGGSGRFDVLELRGDWREMGRQYGYLMRNQMAEFYTAAVDGYLLDPNGAGLSYEELREYAEMVYGFQFPYVQELIGGMSETSGLGEERQRITSNLMGLLFEAGCSSMDAWSDYTAGGPLVVGRNWDTGRVIFRNYSKFLAVVVYNPASGQNSVADINYAGSISMQSGMNSRGLFIDLQNGELSDRATRPVTPGSYQLLSFLLDYGSVDEVSRAFDATAVNLGLIINAADSSSASVFEWSPTAGVRRRTGGGLLASANHFVDPAWPPPLVTGDAVPYGAAGAFSRERYDNLLSSGEQAKGRLNREGMMEIFDRVISEGGPSFPDLTMYHLVALPVERAVWIKAPQYSGWEKVDLGALFD